MKQGTLKISGPENDADSQYGIYINGTPGSGGMYFYGGETEVTSSTRSFVINTENKFAYDSNYSHKNYTGDSAGNRTETADSQQFTTKYALITPAYPIQYDLNGGNLPDGVTNPVLYSRVDSFPLNNPEKVNADFTGWSGTGIDGTSMSVKVAADSKGPRNYTAHYKAQNYTIKFNTNGGSPLNDQIIEPGNTIDQSKTNTVKDGYTLLGWYEDEGLSKEFSLYTLVAKSMTLYAKWAEDKATLKYVAGKGGSVSSKSESVPVFSGKPAGSTAKAASGYQFVSWTDSQGRTVSSKTSFVPKKSGNRFVSESYVANFQKTGGGSSDDSQLV